MHTDHNRNNTTFSNAKNGHHLHKVVIANRGLPERKLCWESGLPLPEIILSWAPLVVFTSALLCFINSIYGNFVFDDSEAIVNNNDLKLDTPLGNIFKNDFWGTKLTHNNSHKSYRPLTVLTFRLNNYLSGGLHPVSFHLVNVILHGIVSALVFYVISTVFVGVLRYQKAPKASFICALLFAVHPIHTESVSAVVGRADLLCALFFFLSFLAYVRGCSRVREQNSILSCSSVAWIGLSLILAGVSMLCKEQGITVIGICSAYDIIVHCRIDISTISNWLSPSAYKSQKWMIQLICRHFLLMVGGVFLLLSRWQIMGARAPVFQHVDNPASFEENIFVRIINYNYIYSLNAWLLLHPLWLCFDWSMGCIPLIKSYTDIRIAAVVIFWTVLLLLFNICIFSKDRKIRRLTTMCMAFLIVPFSPASNIFFRVGFVIAERALFLPSLGVCFLITIGFCQLCLAIPYHRMNFILLILVIITYAGRSVQRSFDWKNEEVLFKSGLDVCPLNAKVHYNIAKNAADNGNRDLAIKEYTEAVSLHPNYDQAMNNLANILKDIGQLAEAEHLLQRAIQIRPDFAAAWMNLGIVQSSIGKVSEAEQSYLTAIHHRKHYPDCYYNLGNLYLEQKQYEKAYQAWKNATVLQPTHLVAWNNMIIMLDSTGDLQRAEAMAQEALEILPNEASLHFNLANTLGKAGRYHESEQHFQKAITLNSNNPTYYTNLGIMLSAIVPAIITSLILISSTTVSSAKPKYVFVSSNSCDRHSLDALYHEKYEIVTEEVLIDSSVFVKNVLQKIEDSLQQVMLQLPGHDKSGKEEMMMHQALKFLQDSFARNVKKIHDNITSHWNDLIQTNHAFLGADDKVAYPKVIKNMEDLYDAYDVGRITMDQQMEKVVSSVKVIAKNGLQALVELVKSGGHHHKNETAPDEGNKTEEEKLKHMVQDLVPSFLRTVTEKILDRNVNLSVPVTKTTYERDSVLDDLCFGVSSMRRRVKALEPDLPEIVEHVDLARRNLYMMWADIVHSFYQDKISEKSKGTHRKGNSMERFEKFWSNEDELANTLVSLMEVYP